MQNQKQFQKKEKHTAGTQSIPPRETLMDHNMSFLKLAATKRGVVPQSFLNLTTIKTGYEMKHMKPRMSFIIQLGCFEGAEKEE